MPDFDRRYEGNVEGFNDYGYLPRQRGGSSNGGPDGYGDSRSQHGSRDHEREFLKSREREIETGKDEDRERERNRDRVCHHRDHYRERGDRREWGRDRDDGDDYHRSRDYGRRRDYDRDREGRHRHRSRSCSRGRSNHRSRSRSRSRSKSKRTSGFDVAPPTSALLPGAVTATGQITKASSAIPGMLPNVLKFSGQFGTPIMMPVQAITQQATRHARRVNVGGLSPIANEQSVATFFSQVMAAIGGNIAGPGDAVVNVYINHEKKFAFVEMRTVEEASNAMALDGIVFEGGPVKVRRPSDYNPSLAATLGMSQPNNLAAVGLTPGSAGGLEGPDRIFVGGIPYYLTEIQIRGLLETRGPLRGFDLVKDRETGNSKGYAFCVYQDPSVTDAACDALNGVKLGNKTLTVRRANLGASQPKPEQENVLLQAQRLVALQRLVFQGGALPTKVVCLTQVVSADELKDNKEYEEIMEDMRGEGGKYGKLVNVAIPRPGPNGELLPGVGKVFLEYADLDGAAKARAGLNGRKFDENLVMATFYAEDKFAQEEYND